MDIHPNTQLNIWRWERKGLHFVLATSDEEEKCCFFCTAVSSKPSLQSSKQGVWNNFFTLGHHLWHIATSKNLSSEKLILLDNARIACNLLRLASFLYSLKQFYINHDAICSHLFIIFSFFSFFFRFPTVLFGGSFFFSCISQINKHCSPILSLDTSQISALDHHVLRTLFDESYLVY